MPRRLIAVLVLTVTVLLAGAGSLYAFDHKAKTKIADGVTVNGVDVGGLTPAQARAKLSATILQPLERPVSVRYQGRRFTLSVERAQIAVDIDGSVDRAMAASQKGNLFTRTWREVRGTELDARVDAQDHLHARGCAQRRPARAGQADGRAARRVGRPRARQRRPGDVARRPRRARPDAAARHQGRAPRHGRHADRPRAHSRGRAQGHDRGARQGVSGDHHRQPRRLPAHAVQGPQAGQDVRHRGRPGRPRDPGRASTTSRTRR